jgi:hypothetical protein
MGRGLRFITSKFLSRKNKTLMENAALTIGQSIDMPELPWHPFAKTPVERMSNEVCDVIFPISFIVKLSITDAVTSPV